MSPPAGSMDIRSNFSSVSCSTHWENACCGPLCVDRMLDIPQELGYGCHMFLKPLLYVSKWVTNIWLLLKGSQRSGNQNIDFSNEWNTKHLRSCSRLGPQIQLEVTWTPKPHMMCVPCTMSNNFAEKCLAQLRPHTKLQVNQKWCAAGRGVVNNYGQEWIAECRSGVRKMWC